MKLLEVVQLFRVLADQSRLMIINALIERPHYVEELAVRLSLSQSTVSFHLKKLEVMGVIESRKDQFYVVYSLRSDILDHSLREMLSLENPDQQVQDERIDRYRRKVMSSFFRYGKLEKIPVQRKKRRIVLEEIAKKFEPGRMYTEKEVNLIIADINDDFCTIRRELIVEQIMERSKGNYWLREAAPDAMTVKDPEPEE